MKLIYKTQDGKFTVELEGNSEKELWRKLAKFQEIFDDNPTATVDNKTITETNYRFCVRKASYVDEKGKEKQAEYFEKRVVGGPLRGYKKDFGALDDGSDNLFPKKAPDENSIKGLNNWYKYHKGQ